ncbi:hypothetical protein A2164_03805 [Candidatus Curtissbacteria bacterium RBG_13_35_7]|uniref:Spore protein YkvP/CgeB glycosyl transferase-like domain-containing protein n=1 Tax=Candidatus Curtissbacteria bacterium RBG_13_35_7 TaxID=1797705 RepID=A0A1F5G319_9BACT|nr:MAG: hypothetical protein A2164_03805 [Candidatus Curtissbacteria bacterium RBG_13_35_7]
MKKQGKKPKKILLVIAGYSSFRDPLDKAFKTLGVKTTYFDNRKTTLFEKLFFSLSLIYPPIYRFATGLINNRLVKKVEKTKPDLILVSKGENISAGTVKKISQKTTIVNWYTDYFYNSKRITKMISAYDAFFTQDTADVKSYRIKGCKNVYCLPYAGPLLNLSPFNKKYDVVFLGTFSKKREQLFEKLNRFNFKIWGDKRWQKSKLNNNYMGKWLNFDEMIHTLKKSKIVVNNHQNRVLNLRVYETTAAGALLITDFSPDLPFMYKIGKEVIVYRNKNDLFQKVRYYLKNDLQREKIANAGYKRQKNDHTYTKRLKEMFNIIK